MLGLLRRALRVPLLLRGGPRLRLREAIVAGVRRAHHLVVALPQGKRRLRVIGSLALLVKVW